MITTDPAYTFRNQCINFMVEAYNFNGYQAFLWVGEDYFTHCWKNDVEYMKAVNDFIEERKCN